MYNIDSISDKEGSLENGAGHWSERSQYSVLSCLLDAMDMRPFLMFSMCVKVNKVFHIVNCDTVFLICSFTNV